MRQPTKIESQLDRLLAQDFSQMGYQARIRHQQRIEELRALHESRSPDAEPDQDSAYAVADEPAEV
ncbi:MAG: hypothetical protein IH989_02460 [Planctomycetes bacterium]|nr:hypothetical protein [Planctomycetota bacterium]